MSEPMILDSRVGWRPATPEELVEALREAAVQRSLLYSDTGMPIERDVEDVDDALTLIQIVLEASDD